MTRYRGRLTRGEVAAANREIIKRAQLRSGVQRIKVEVPERPAKNRKSKNPQPPVEYADHTLRKRMIERFTGIYHSTVHICTYCGGEVRVQSAEYTMDHLIPKSAGGNNSDANAWPAHQQCNLDKGNLLPDEYLNILLRRYDADPTPALAHQVFRLDIMARYATRMGDKLYRKY